MQLLAVFAALAATISTCSAHLILTYPGTRGYNLHNDTGNTTACHLGTMDDYNGANGCFPYGMQWMYPCGGLPSRTDRNNRTYWPLTGGAVAFQPGWFTGHSTAFMYINIGLGTIPPNMSHPMVPVFQVVGPTNDAYPGKSVCIPQVGMPANLSLHEGMNATIQVVEAAKHGAALYSCVDVILTGDHKKVAPVTHENCHNSTGLSFNLVFSTLKITNGGISRYATPNAIGAAALAFGVMLAGLWL